MSEAIHPGVRKRILNQKLELFAKMDPEKTHLGPWIREFKAELRSFGLTTNIRFCFDKEWYYADGTEWISIPFYLASPRLSQITQRSKVNTEGHSRKVFLKLLRHEYGHYLEAKYATRRWKMRREVFGADPIYPKSYLPNKNPKDFVSHLPDYYAQSHPDEDFAETFAVFIRGEKYWKKKYQASGAYKKLLAMGSILKECSMRKARKLDRSSYRPLKNQKSSIGLWIQKSLETHERLPVRLDPQLVSAQSYIEKKWKLGPLESHYVLRNLAMTPSSNLLSIRSKDFKTRVNRIIRTKSHYINM